MINLKHACLAYILFLLIIPFAYAQEEYTNGWQVPVGFLGSDLYSPKVACNSDYSVCIMLTYDNNPLNKRVVMFKSYDLLQSGTPHTLVSIDYSNVDGYANYLTWATNYSFPYDVYYDRDEDVFYLLNRNTLYKYDYSFITTVCSAGNDVSFIGFLDNGDILGILYYDIYFKTYVYDKNCNEKYQVGYHPNVSLYDCDNPLSDKPYVYVKGFFMNNSGNITYKLYVKSKCFDGSYWHNNPDMILDTLSLPFNYDGLSYYNQYLNTLALYRYNDTDNLTNGIWRTSKTPIGIPSEWESPSLYYAFNESNQERIPLTDLSYNYGDRKMIYVYERRTNTSETGIWAYAKNLYEIYVTAENLDSDNNYKQTIPITVELQCGNYTYTSTGINNWLYTPCLTGNNITFIASQLEPHVYTLENFTVDETFTSITLKYLKSRYNISVSVIDAYNLSGVSNASVQMGLSSNYTGSQGHTVLGVDVIDDATFNVTQKSTWQYELWISGVPKQHHVQITKQGYRTYIKNDETFMQFENNKPVLSLYKSYKIIPVMTTLEVHLLTSDYVEIYPSSARLYSYGGNGTQIYRENLYPHFVPINYATQFPATFVYNDTRLSFNVNLSLYYAGQTYNATVTVIKDNITVYYFILPFTQFNMPCLSNSDCMQESFCSDNIYYQFQGCVDNICKYDFEQCSYFCDDLAGCYDITTTKPCSECETYCFDNFTMVIEVCGSDGYCKGKLYPCDTYCTSFQDEQNITRYGCKESIACLYGTNKQRFTLRLPEVEGYAYPPIFYDKEVVCNMDNADTHICIPSVSIKKSDLAYWGKTVQDLVVEPEDWQYRETDDAYEFLAVSVYCDQECNLTYELCRYGCDLNTGLCLGKGATSYWEDMTAWLMSITPTWLLWIYNPGVLWTFFSLFVSLLSIWLVSKGIQPVHVPWQLGISIMFVMYIIGLLLGFVDVIIGVMILIGLGILLARTITKVTE